jgi:tetratricopeptide (TPR) repeat protein
MLELTRARALERLALVERALTLDPNDFWALQYEARWRAGLVLLGFSSDPAADVAIAERAADRMLRTVPNNLLALRSKAAVLRAQGNWDEAAAVLRRVIAMQPLESNRRWELGMVLMAQGNHKEALATFMTAKQLAAGADYVFYIDTYLALALLENNRFDEAIEQAKLAISEFPPDSGRAGEFPWLALIAGESENGQEAQARADLQKFAATTRMLCNIAEIHNVAMLAKNANMFEGLRRAGMPES